MARSRTMGTPAAGRPRAVSRTWVVIALIEDATLLLEEPLDQAEPGDLPLLLRGDHQLDVRIVVHAAHEIRQHLVGAAAACAHDVNVAEALLEIGRASCRERVSVAAVAVRRTKQ